jgi:hypothetical protein
VRPMSPIEPKEQVDTDVYMADQVGFQHNTDLSTGEKWSTCFSEFHDGSDGTCLEQPMRHFD